MSRPLRIQYENAFYHIISRGDLKRYIFKKPSYKQTFMEKMNETFEKYNIECYAYCIMDNHYHLYIRTEEANLSEAMKYLNESYANWYRAASQKPGHVFQGRYKSILIDKDNYSNKLVDYIHLNPLRAKIVNKPEEYRYSSLNYYLGNENKRIDRLNRDFILEQFDNDLKKASKKYYKNLIENIGNKEIERGVYKSLAIGDELFIKEVEERLSNINENIEFKSTKMKKSRSPKKIIETIIKEFEIKETDIFNKKKNNIYKKLTIYLLRKKTRMKNKEIGKMFDIKESSVSSIVKRFKVDTEIKSELKEMLNRVMRIAPV